MVGGIITDVGNIKSKKTGSWRTFRPIVDKGKCIGCGTCKTFCPDVSIEIVDGKAIIDYDHCKGCLICKSVCPVGAISSEEEAK